MDPSLLGNSWPTCGSWYHTLKKEHPKLAYNKGTIGIANHYKELGNYPKIGDNRFNEVQKQKNSSKLLAVYKNDEQSLEQLLKFDENGRCINAYEVISMLNTLAASYQLIKSKPGNMTPGIDGETLDGIDMEYFNKLSNSLRNVEFKCRPTRRIYIPKVNGKLRLTP